MCKHEMMMKLQVWNMMYKLFEFNTMDPKYVWTFSDEEKVAYSDLSKSLGWGGMIEAKGLRCTSVLTNGAKNGSGK